VGDGVEGARVHQTDQSASARLLPHSWGMRGPYYSGIASGASSKRAGGACGGAVGHRGNPRDVRLSVLFFLTPNAAAWGCRAAPPILPLPRRASE
jgi:hypothetical protein